MVLTKEELISSLQKEAQILNHLVSKIQPAMLEYRPTPGQRPLLELLRYLTIFCPVHLRGALADSFSMEAWGQDWNAEEAIAKARSFEELVQAIAGQTDVINKGLGDFPEDRFRDEFEMFGQKMSRGSWVVMMVLNHYAAYRMQLFLYLKGAGLSELNTINLWMGMDGSMTPPS